MNNINNPSGRLLFCMQMKKTTKPPKYMRRLNNLLKIVEEYTADYYDGDPVIPYTETTVAIHHLIRARDMIDKRIARLKELRDADRCAICGVIFSATVPPTLDHIIPLSKGGTATPDNVHCVCLYCNSCKGGSIPEPKEEETVL